MRRLILLAPLLLLLLHPHLYGQTPVIQWQKALGSFNGDYTQSIRPTADGGYIVGGYTEGADGDVVGYHGNLIIGDIWVTKLSAAGDIQWQKCLGGVYTEVNADIRQTPDGGYILAASSASVDCGIPGNHGGLDFWLLKLSPKGDVQWQKMLGGSGNEYATSISPAADGGYFVGGYTSSSDGQVTGYHSSGIYGFDWWVIKVDGSGNLQWQKDLGGSGDYDQCNSVQATPDGGCIAAGQTNSFDGDITGNHGKSDAMVVKFSPTGTVQWQKIYGGSGMDGAWSIQLTADGGYIFAGFAGSNDGDISGNHQLLGSFQDFWVVKLDASGVLQWQKCYGGQYNEIAYYLQVTSDGGYAVTGSAESANGDLSCNAGLTDTWVIKINSTGALQWSKSMGGGYYDQESAIQPLPDGSFIVAANTCSIEVPGFHKHTTGNGSCADYWIIKLSAPTAIAPAPVVTLSPASATVCAGMPATFTATVLNTGVHPSYQWSRNGLAVGSDAPTYTASDFSANDVVKVTVQSGTGVCDMNGSQATASVTVHINNNILHPTIKISGSNALCTCAPATFALAVTGGGSSPSYQWMINGVINGTSSDSWLSSELKPGDKVSCQYSDSSGCIAGAPITSNTITLTGGSGSPASVSVIGPPDAICSGTSVSFTASPVNAGTNPSYQWQVNGVNAGTDSSGFVSSTLSDGDMVTCTITPDPLFPCATGGNALSNPVIVHLSPKTAPQVSTATPSTLLCKGDTVSFTATAQAAGQNPSFQWEVNGVPNGTTGPGFSSYSLANGDIVQCIITVDPTYSCALTNTAVSAPVTLQVIDQPDPTVSISASPASACLGSLIGFDASPQDAGTGPSFQWLVNGSTAGGNGPVFGSSGLGNNDIVTCMMVPGTGACQMKPVLSNPVVAILWSLPQVTISPADTTVLSGGQARLNARVSANVTSFTWSPAGMLTDPLSPDPTTVPLEDSVQYILSAETVNGCQATANAKVRIYRAVRMPNAFTPNGNGANDLFRIPPGINLQLEEFSVYDRWGNRVFSTRNAGTGWDGTIRGHPAEAGVYVYTIAGKDIKGPVTAKGTVILVR